MFLHGRSEHPSGDHATRSGRQYVWDDSHRPRGVVTTVSRPLWPSESHRARRSPRKWR